MDSISAKQLLTETRKFLTKLLSLSEIITYGQKHKKNQILPCDLSYVNVCMSEKMKEHVYYYQMNLIII